MHACPHVALHSPDIVQLQGTDAPTHTHTHWDTPGAEFSVLVLAVFPFLLTSTNFIFNWLATRTRRRARLTTSNWALKRQKGPGPSQKVSASQDTRTQSSHTHTYTRTQDRDTHKEISAEIQASFFFLPLCVCVCVAQESFSFLSFQFRCQQSCFLYYTTYFISSGRNVCALCKPSPQSQSHPLSLRKPYPLESFLRNCATHNSFANRNSLICCLCVCVSRMTRISLTGLQSFWKDPHTSDTPTHKGLLYEGNIALNEPPHNQISSIGALPHAPCPLPTTSSADQAQ